MYKRFGRKWDVPEIIALQREYEILELTIDQIAEKHKRSPNAIMRKLDKEGFAVYEDLLEKYENQKMAKQDTKSELSCSTINICQIETSESTKQVIEELENPKKNVSLFEEINIEGSEEDIKLANTCSLTEQKEVKKNSMCVLS